MPKCATCHDVAWVCEAHPDRPWSVDVPGGCECDAGMPCPACNDSDPTLRRDNLPTLPPDFKIDVDKNGSRH
jgi:hypothetical protein